MHAPWLAIGPRLAFLVVTVSVAATVATVTFYLRNESVPGTFLGALRPVDKSIDLASIGHREGDAKRTMVVFADYQCEACRALQTAIDELNGDATKSVTVVYRHFPLTNIHPAALEAALAAECAGEQGQFKAMHRVLYSNQAVVGRLPWRDFGDSVTGLDSNRFTNCLRSRRYLTRVEADVAAARSLTLAGTPGFILGDSLYVGSRNAKQLAQLLR